LAVDKFFFYYLVVNLTGLCASSVAFCVSAGIRVTAVGNLLIVIIFVVSMVRRYKSHHITNTSSLVLLKLCSHWQANVKLRYPSKRSEFYSYLEH